MKLLLVAVALAALGYVLTRKREQWPCAVKGHQYLLHIEGRDLKLRCSDCGHVTHGWRNLGKPEAV